MRCEEVTEVEESSRPGWCRLALGRKFEGNDCELRHLTGIELENCLT